MHRHTSHEAPGRLGPDGAAQIPANAPLRFPSRFPFVFRRPGSYTPGTAGGAGRRGRGFFGLVADGTDRAGTADVR